LHFLVNDKSNYIVLILFIIRAIFAILFIIVTKTCIPIIQTDTHYALTTVIEKINTEFLLFSRVIYENIYLKPLEYNQHENIIIDYYNAVSDDFIFLLVERCL